MKKYTVLIENLKLSFLAIRANKLRAVLTILIIAVGLMALMGILTATESIKGSITSEFTSMGANSFSIESRGRHIQIGSQEYRRKNYAYITYKPKASKIILIFRPWYPCLHMEPV